MSSLKYWDMGIMQFIRDYFGWTYRPLKRLINEKIVYYLYRKAEINRLKSISSSNSHVFYLGITEQPNLGDMAQYYCIREWIKNNYPEREMVMVESKVITDSRFTDRFFDALKKIFNNDDIIVIQSGYNTQDLGGDHPLMHRLVCDYMTDAKILMMPQTIFFQNDANKRLCAENHNKAKNMFFLARDFQSYEMAKQMFPSIRVKAFPDIVTVLIGTFHFNNSRKGVCICARNDGEKFFSNEEMVKLSERIQANGKPVQLKDTQGKRPFREIRANVQQFVEAEIESYSHFEVTITDRYHGTIFSLCAGTPVIIIKTTDHKVTTGADWFQGVYDDYVFVAKDLEEAYTMACSISSKKLDYVLSPYFKNNYYDKLRELFEND